MCITSAQVILLKFRLFLRVPERSSACDAGGGIVSVLKLTHWLQLCGPAAEWDTSSEPHLLFSSVVVKRNRSKAGAGGPLSATGTAAVPVERHGAAAPALDR